MILLLQFSSENARVESSQLTEPLHMDQPWPVVWNWCAQADIHSIKTKTITPESLLLIKNIKEKEKGRNLPPIFLVLLLKFYLHVNQGCGELLHLFLIRHQIKESKEVSPSVS